MQRKTLYFFRFDKIPIPYSADVEVNVEKSVDLTMDYISDSDFYQLRNKIFFDSDEELIISYDTFANIKIYTGIDQEVKVSFNFKITERGIFEISNASYQLDGQKHEATIETRFDGEMTEDEINESVKIEEEMSIDDAKLNLKFQFENFKEEFYSFFPSIVDDVKSQVSNIRSWYQENENKRLDLAEYTNRSKEFQILTSRALEQKEKYTKVAQNFESLENKVLNLLETCETINDQRVAKIAGLLNSFLQKIRSSKETSKHKDVDFNFEKNAKALNALESNIGTIKNCKK